MKRVLMLDGGIINGEMVRDLISTFPESESAFRQRKQYDEYYFNGCDVEVTLEKIQQLNDMYYSVSISSEDILIEE